MNLWQGRTLGIIDIGGGAVGILATFAALYAHLDVGSSFVLIPFVLLYCFAIYAGVLSLERSESAISTNWWLWLVQIPIFTSPAFSYIFSCGALLATSIQISPINYKFNWMLGSQFKLSLNQNDPTLIGVNILALAIFVWLSLEKRRPAP